MVFRPRAFKIFLNSWLKGQPWFHPVYKKIRRARYETTHINWENYNSGSLPDPIHRSQKILLATSTGGQLPASYMEQTLGVALKLRGADVNFLLCDGALPACMLCEYSLMRDTKNFIHEGPSALLCGTCFNPAAEAVAPLAIPLLRYGQYLEKGDSAPLVKTIATLEVKEIQTFMWDEIPLGEQAYAGACRFFGSADPLAMPNGAAVLKHFLLAAWLTKIMIERLLIEQKPDIVVLHHGIYIPQGIIAAVAKQRNIRIVTWHPAYRKNTFIFSHGDTYHRTMIHEDTASWETMEWNSEKRARIQEYLKSRHTGKGDWIWFHEKPRMDQQHIIETLKLDMSKPVIGLLTNVGWDAQLHYPNNAYPNMFSWIFDTVDFFIANPHLQLIIRIHPAEVYGNVISRQTTEAVLKQRYGNLPDNIKIIPPLSDLSTYVAMDLCSTVLIYSTKTAIELAAIGKPLIICGDSWLRGKGLAYDIVTPDEYQGLLAQLPFTNKTAIKNIERGERYAYHFFFRRMIQLDIFKQQSGNIPFKLEIESISELQPGQCLGLDLICNGIMNETAFVIP